MTCISWSDEHQRAQRGRASMIGLHWLQLGIKTKEAPLSVDVLLDQHPQ